MEQGYWMTVFILIVGLFPSTVWLIINRKRFEQNPVVIYYIKIILFFSCCNYFFSSVAKWCLGNQEKTLVESFMGTGFRTYVHYGTVLFLIDIVILIGILWLFRQWVNTYIGVFDAGMLILIVTVIFFIGSINNVLFCVLFMVCGVLSLLLTRIGKVNPVYFTLREYPKAFQEAVPAVASWIVTIGIYLPSELYISNADEFTIRYGGYITTLLIGSLVTGVLLITVTVVLFSLNFYKFFVFFLSGVSIMSYIQAMFLNGKLQSLTGEKQTWTTKTQIINLVFWVLIIGMIMFGSYYKEGVKKGCKVACIYIMLIQVISLGYLLVTEKPSNTTQQTVMTTEGSLTIATDDNILVFVLDTFDSSGFDALDTEFIEPLSDFTYYENATSRYGNTDEAIPYLLENTEYRYDRKTNSIETYSDARTDALFCIHQKGYDIGIYTLAEYLSADLCDISVNCKKDAEYTCNYANTIKTMFKTSMYRILPFTLKSQYSYFSTDITSIAEIDGAWNILNDLPFYQSLKKDGLYVDENCQLAFRFYHMFGVHPPHYLAEGIYYDKSAGYTEQSKGCLKIIYEYLEQLKALGKYDNATIIITADHGQLMKRDDTGTEILGTSSPIMLVKEAQEHHKSIAISDAPVTQGELMPEVLKAAGIDWAEYGNIFSEVDEKEERERKYSYKMFNIATEYLINGYVKDIDNWSLENIYQY